MGQSFKPESGAKINVYRYFLRIKFEICVTKLWLEKLQHEKYVNIPTNANS